MSRRRVDIEYEQWDRAQTEARARLARIERGESAAPEPVVRVLRLFVAPERRPGGGAR